jgi:protein-disulfide isomerase
MSSPRSANVFDLSTTLIAMAALVCVAYQVFVPLFDQAAGSSGQPNGVPSATADGNAAVDELNLLAAEGHVVGLRGAPARIVEFGSFTCSYCGAFHKLVRELDGRFPDLISVTYIHSVPDSGSAYRAALASECAAEQGKFTGYYDLLLTGGAGFYTHAELARVAVAAGMADTAAFHRCLEVARYGPKVRAQSAAAKRLGVKNTPTWVLNNRINIGLPTLADLEGQVKLAIRPK